MIRRQFFQAFLPAPLIVASRAIGIDCRDEEYWLSAIRESPGSIFLDASTYSRSRSHFRRALTYFEGVSTSRKHPNIVLGLHGTALAHVVPPNLWLEYGLTNLLSTSEEEAHRNEQEQITFHGLIANGRLKNRLTILACEQTMRQWISASRGALAVDESLTIFKNRLLAPAIAVHAMVISAAKAQQANASYFLSTP